MLFRSVSDPQHGPEGYRVLVMLERREASATGSGSDAPGVLAEFRRRAAETALREYLRKLREDNSVELDLKDMPDAGAPQE